MEIDSMNSFEQVPMLPMIFAFTVRYLADGTGRKSWSSFSFSSVAMSFDARLLGGQQIEL
jgi:hypothetical protein